ncbi:putative deoxyribonuclease YcfH [compost metagenome]
MPAYGFHPEQPVPDEAATLQLFDWIRNRYAEGKIFAIGEVGLPYFTRTNAEQAGESFDESGHMMLLDRFAALATELDRPIALHVIHEDGPKVCDLLERHGVRRAHFHYFKGDRATIDRMIESGYYVSITPEVLYDEQSRELVRLYPIELMMTETDGPWPFKGPFQDIETTPLLASDVVREIAVLKGIGVQQAAVLLAGNAKKLYDFILEP